MEESTNEYILPEWLEEEKRKFELKRSASEIEFNEVLYNDPNYIKLIVDELEKRNQNGENVYIKCYAKVPYKIYSCDLKGKDKQVFLGIQEFTYRKIEQSDSRDVLPMNGFEGKPEIMMEKFDKNPNSIFVYNGNSNGVSAVFTREDFDIMNDEDFLNYSYILMSGKTVKERKIEREEWERKYGKEIEQGKVSIKDAVSKAIKEEIRNEEIATVDYNMLQSKEEYKENYTIEE